MTTVKLYDGEKQDFLDNYPVLTKFISGDASKPLVAFIPGLAHNARISYGGHHKSHSEDFIAHWFHEHGYGFLGISYPLETDPEIMPPTGRELSLRDWGKQAAKAMKKVVDEHEVSSKVVILAWSMGGKILEAVTVEAKALGLTVSLFVSLAATPALWGLRRPVQQSHAILTPAGYWDNRFLHGRFLSQLAEQNQLNDGRTIIDESVYKREYFGATPGGSGGWGFRYSTKERKLIEDKWALLEEGRVDNYGNLPAMAAISPTSPLDWRHSMTDNINWSYLIIHKFVVDAQKIKETRKASISEMDVLEHLKAFIYEIPDRMITDIEGNHFFFVGAKGAKQTAEIVIRFMQEAENIQTKFENLRM
ncbi:hypothetical protein N7510_006924 [Penicillium lagena]|uniref:uncharacterized protein n=1 Tax=Penicillium lagena TaxID=94218 RepID=UPI00254248C9|nr:uncharacterized protein N7510_006924 [Penicillium lagena]KAJ5610205.1 hypothetical protein N7510_006924 [Penicillium lagena]